MRLVDDYERGKIFPAVMIVVFLVMCVVLNIPWTTPAAKDPCRTTIIRGEHHVTVTVACKLDEPPPEEDDDPG